MVRYSDKAKPITDEVFDYVVEQIDATVTEFTFQSREAALKAYHSVGELLRDSEKQHKLNITQLVERCAANNRLQEIKMGKTNLWFALKFYDTWPKLSSLPDGKNASITKVKALLMPPRPKPEETIEDVAKKLYNKFDDKDLKKLINLLEGLLKQKRDEEDAG